MFNFVKNEKGAILTYVVAIVIALISMISSLSLASLTRSDSLQKNYQHDLIQEDILLRSEGARSQMSIEINPNRPIPGREVEVLGDIRVTTYKIKNSKVLTNLQNFMGYATKQALKISSEVTAKRKKIFHSNPGNQATKLYGSIESPAIRLTERFLQNESLSKWQYFTDTEESINADGGTEAAAVKFWGRDVLWGPLHSNSDIWIQQGGGGSNNGWPTFYGHVSTSGKFKGYPSGADFIQSGAPIEDIFLGGYSEEVAHVGFDPEASDLRSGPWVFPQGAYDLCYVELNGVYADVFKATITSTVQEFKTRSWYPQDADWVDFAIANDVNWLAESDTIMTNYVTIYDTLWSPGSVATGDGSSYFVPCELWIKGEVSGNQCWGASGKVRIVGDILYTNNDPGTFPDGFSGIDDETNEPEYNGTVNGFDYFGLVSEDKMYVGYKYKHPVTGEIEDDNCAAGEDENVYLYGAYAAIAVGDADVYGDMAGHYDGEFSFEYQHPHGSTPNIYNTISPYTGGDTTYTYIDLHKYIFPINELVPPIIAGFNVHSNPRTLSNIDGRANGYPNYSQNYLNSLPNNGPNYVIPLGTDYPWYNPVWPEAINTAMFERGTLHIYGSIAQRRRGFIHRSGTDPYNHVAGSPWEMDEYHFGGDHNSTGYDKDYAYDRRFLYIQPKNFPEVYRGYGDSAITPFEAYNWSFKSPSDN